MAGAVVVRGRVRDPRHVELEEPLEGLGGEVEVTLRPLRSGGVTPEAPVEVWLVAFDGWLAARDASLPALPPGVLRRSSLYDDR